MMHENDSRFPDESPVLVRYPLDGPRSVSDRAEWPWLPGTIEQQCGPDEWLVTIEDRRLAELGDGSPAPGGHAGRGPAVPAVLPRQLGTPANAGTGGRTMTAYRRQGRHGHQRCPA
jgi:hypothetical protein